MDQNLLNVFTIIQFFFAVVIGLYFWNMLRNQQGTKRAVVKESRKELNKLREMRRISLTEPLAEKTRPTGFEDIIGQKEGIEALKAALCGPNPQHVILYGPPGVGKTAAARLVLETAKRNPLSPFKRDAKFIEIDGTTARFDERSIADPLIGSVHDPIYQGAGPMGMAGIPQPKPGAVTKAHGGVLFIDEIGELHPIQMNKLLKVLEDRKVFLDSAYYSEEDTNIPQYIHDIFQNGLPADFRLIGATTRQPDEIPPAIRSRCLEIFFRELSTDEIRKIAVRAVKKIRFKIEDKALDLIEKYAKNGRETVNMVQLAGGIAIAGHRQEIKAHDIEKVLNNGQYSPRLIKKIHGFPQIGVVNGLAVRGPNIGMLLEIEVAAIKKRSSPGQIKITGVIEEEEIGSMGHTVRRKSMARESAENALTVLRRMMPVDPHNYDIHVNFPGGIPVDGPSAGVAMSVAIYSAITKKPVDNHIAMTGEVSIRGLVKPVGGIAAKIEAASKAGARKVLIPRENWQNLFELRDDIEIIPIETLEEAIEKSVAIKEDEKIKLIKADSLMTVPQ
ncbi:ATP-dependent protease LonB [Halothermothrix orenii]|uniref:endopeptidase La n=1 Tax=Halothermothrix orenii (strain H 168 / OCM 544 / DSM 9562) TaxID=373903 RepID=B8CY72_HALOH|nr:ATP-dependent protease LonB [Halothermothrix orenii]ACL70241.1 Sporulation protease LonB [Halothermothrix orenii H 168]